MDGWMIKCFLGCSYYFSHKEENNKGERITAVVKLHRNVSLEGRKCACICIVKIKQETEITLCPCV